MALFKTQGLRNKTLLSLLAANGLTLVVALLIGMLALDSVRDDMGRSYINSRVQISKQQMLGTILPELALSRRLAASVLSRQWALNETDTAARKLFFQEAEGYREMLESRAYFFAIKESGHFFHNDGKSAFSDQARYTVSQDQPADAWFFATITQPEPYNINVDTDHVLKKTKIWFNVPVKDERGRAIGVTGSGLELQTFLDKFIHDSPPGVTVMMLDQRGLIQAHPNPDMIEFAAVGKATVEQTLHRLLDEPEDQAALSAAMENLKNGSTETASGSMVFRASMSGQPHLLALAYIPEIQWYVVAALDMDVYSLFDNPMIRWSIVGVLLLMVALVLLTLVGFDRMVLLPLSKLTQSARELASGNYDVQLNSDRTDELGELTRTFDVMAKHVLDHTRHLEDRVQQRTQALREAHQKIDVAHQALTESIDAARLFQSALLPNAQVLAAFPGEFSALWLPRDGIGGDLYVIRPSENGCLIALMDCAGHGVPGAFMTMIAHAALDVALNDGNRQDPAALLKAFDQTIRTMVPSRERFGRITTDMDMAVCYLDFAQQKMIYAGARIALRFVDATGYHMIPPSKRNIGGNKSFEFENVSLELKRDTTFYLCTDGVLDQNGGPKGFSIGEAGCKEMLVNHHGLTLDQCTSQFAHDIDAYRRERAQRDDITVLAFRSS